MQEEIKYSFAAADTEAGFPVVYKNGWIYMDGDELSAVSEHSCTVYMLDSDMKNDIFAYAGETCKQLTDGSTICTISDYGRYTLRIYRR